MIPFVLPQLSQELSQVAGAAIFLPSLEVLAEESQNLQPILLQPLNILTVRLEDHLLIGMSHKANQPVLANTDCQCPRREGMSSYIRLAVIDARLFQWRHLWELACMPARDYGTQLFIP